MAALGRTNIASIPAEPAVVPQTANFDENQSPLSRSNEHMIVAPVWDWGCSEASLGNFDGKECNRSGVDVSLW